MIDEVLKETNKKMKLLKLAYWNLHENNNHPTNDNVQQKNMSDTNATKRKFLGKQRIKQGETDSEIKDLIKPEPINGRITIGNNSKWFDYVRRMSENTIRVRKEYRTRVAGKNCNAGPRRTCNVGIRENNINIGQEEMERYAEDSTPHALHLTV